MPNPQPHRLLPSQATVIRALGSALLLLVVIAQPAAATDSHDLPWPTKTGPLHNGNPLAEHADGLPVTWNEPTGQNIAWKTPLAGAGHCTPAIGNGRVWLTSATEDGKQQFVYCIDSASGEVLHHKLLFENADPEPLGNAINSYASPTCFLTGDAVYVHFGTYGTARLEPETAEVVWQRRDLNVRHFRGPGSSPILADGLLILTFDGIDKQFVTALNPETGDTVWETPRSTDYKDLDENGQPTREGDLRKAYSTPAIVEVAGKKQVLSPGSRAAFGYDLATGEEIWTVTYDDYNASAEPLVYDGSAIFTTGSGGLMLRVKVDASTRGDVTGSPQHVIWSRRRGNPKLPFPVLHKDRIYFATDNGGVATCVDADTGEDVWQKRLGGNFTASPLVANDLVYFFDDGGKTTVVRAADEYEVVATNELTEGMRASPAVADGALYLRTFGHLYKIADSAEQADRTIGQ
jgi:outer membrane protein assembly factor BamB